MRQRMDNVFMAHKGCHMNGRQAGLQITDTMINMKHKKTLKTKSATKFYPEHQNQTTMRSIPSNYYVLNGTEE